jgi:hydroxypyruvate reductase
MKDHADPKLIARRIFERTLEAVDPSAAVERCLDRVGDTLSCGGRPYDLGSFPDLRVLAVGKAAHRMLEGLLAVLPGEAKLRGVVSAPTPPANPHSGFRYFVSGHPEPNEASLLAGESALKMVRGATAETLFIVLLSGGGSALMEFPLLPALSLSEVRQLNRALVTSAAGIHEINTVRKHLSAVKGGRLALAAGPATILTLAISDVPAGRESALASGPTVADPTTSSDVRAIIARHNLAPRLPPAILAWVDAGRMPETPKPGDAAFRKVQFELLLGMHELFHAAHRIAESEGFAAFCDNTTDDWPVEKAADFLLAQLEALGAQNPGQPVALIADGELSSAVTGTGMGGRNSAFVLASVEGIAGKPVVVLSAGTDGMDGNSPAAGAVADGRTLARSRAAGLDPQDFFRKSDSFRFFEALGDAIVTGPSGTNLRDLRLLLAFPREKP